MLFGIDVANYQRKVDWSKVRAAGNVFAWVLATDGSAFVDTYAPDDVAGCVANGIAAGGYHFARPSRHDATVEAGWFVDHLPAGCVLPPALDVERDWLPSREENTAWVLAWFNTVDDRRRLLYTNLDGITNHLLTSVLAGEGVELWFAHPTGTPSLHGAAGWAAATIVQYGTGPVAGVDTGPVDLDAMGDDTLQHLTAGATPAPPLPPGEEELATYTYVKVPDEGNVYLARRGELPLHVGTGDLGYADAEALVGYQGDRVIEYPEGEPIEDAHGQTRTVLVLQSPASRDWFGLR